MYSTDLPLPPNATNEKGTRDCVIRCVSKLVAWFKPSFQFVYVNHLCTWNPGQKEFALGTRAETVFPEVHLSGKGAADIYMCTDVLGSLAERSICQGCQRYVCATRHDPPPSLVCTQPPHSILLPLSATQKKCGSAHTLTQTPWVTACPSPNNSGSLVPVGEVVPG